MKKITLLFAFCLPIFLQAQTQFWSSVSEDKIEIAGSRVIIPKKYKTFQLVNDNLKSALFSAPNENIVTLSNSTSFIELPMPDGSIQKFRIVESPVMEKELALQFPTIKTFNATSVDELGTYAKLDWTEFGFHGMVRRVSGDFFIDPYSRNNIKDYIVYNTSDFMKPLSQRLPEIGIVDVNGNIINPVDGNPQSSALIDAGTNLRTYRLALACTGEYAIAATGISSPSTAQILSVVTTSVNRVDGVYETEVAVKLVLVANETTILYGNASTDPFTGNNNANTLINESQTVITNNIGSANYDIGHTFSTGGGGLAGLGVVCTSTQKARGITGSPSPVGDPYDIDYVAHEMGHEFGGNHTFSSALGSCGGNQHAGTMVEPGSGVTIMAYAGICSTDDLDPHSIAYFHTISYDEIMAYTNTGGGNACPVNTATGNHSPVVTGSANYTIPKSTPFALTGSATDSDGDPLTYSWEEIDNNSTAHALGTGAAPYFRSYNPTSSPTRLFPLLSTILTGSLTALGNYLPATAQTLNFRLVARDNRMGGGGVSYAGNQVIIASSGPFAVTAPNTTGITWASGSTQTVTWNVNSTNTAPVSCANVNILLSLDGGNTFTSILSNTPNDGTESITVPSQGTTVTTCRIKVEAVANIFFDINDKNFTISAATGPIAPTAAFTSNTAAPCVGGTVNFTDQSSGVPTSWSWSFPGGTPSSSTSQNPSVVYNTAGTYSVSLTATNANGSNTLNVGAYITVNPVVTPAVSISASSSNVCAGASVTFTATPTNGGTTPSYQWKVNGTNAGTNSNVFNTSTLANTNTVTCIMTSNAVCASPTTATSSGIVMTVNAATTPAVTVSLTTGTNPECANASAIFTATPSNALSPSYQWKLNGGNVGTNNTTYSNAALANSDVVSCVMTASSACPTLVTLGTSTVTNTVATTTSDVGTAYPTYYGSGRQQYLIKASELTTLGLSAGNITSLAFYVVGSAGNPATLNGYTIKTATTTATVLTTTFQAPTFTTVFGPVNYTPTLNALNTHSLSTPINWNGTSNLIVDICFSNGVTGAAAYQNYQTTTSFVSTTYYQFDGTTSTACTIATGSGTGSVRPNITFTSTGLTTATSNSVTMTVNTNVTPSLSVSPSATNICAGTSVSFTATPTNGGTTPSYQWMVNGVNAGTNATIFTSTSLANTNTVTCVMTSNASCLTSSNASSNGVVMTVNPSVTPSVSILSSATTICAGTSVTFTATPTNGGTTPSYQWKVNGVNAGTNAATFTSSTLANTNTVTCIMTSNATCAVPSTATSNGIVMIVNANVAPSVSVTSNTTNSCAGALVTFTATPTNGGATPSYQWKLNGTNTGTNSAIYSSTSLTNGQNVSCVLTSNASCLTGSTATSNSVTITVNQNTSISIEPTAQVTCENGNATFSVTANGAGLGYQWEFTTNGIVWNSASIGAPYFNANTNTLNIFGATTTMNTFNYRCVVTGTCGSVTSIPAQLTVNPSVTPAVSILPSATNICAGTPVTFTATATNGGASPSYQWQVNGVNVGTNLNTFTTTSLTNVQPVTCILTSNASCASSSTATSNSIAITVNSSVTPSVSIIPSATDICSGTAVTFTATATNGGTSPGYQWQVNGVNAGTNSNTFTTTSLTNAQSVTCILTSNANCAASSTATSNGIAITVNSSVTSSVSIVPSTTNICAGTAVIFTATATNGGTSPSYQWQVNGVNAGTNSNTFITTSLTNTQPVTCILTSNASCATSSTATSNSIAITVNSSVTPSVSIVPSTTNICAGTPVTFTATATNGGASPSYQWQVNGVNAGTNSNIFTTTSLINAQPVTCILTSNASCVISSTATSNSIAITVNICGTAPVANFTASATQLCINNSVTFTDASTNTPTSWSWIFQGGNPATSTLQSPVVNYSIAGTYSVSLTATNGSGSNTKTMLSYIKVFSGIPATPGVIAGPINGLCPAGLSSATYSVVAVTNASTYTWTAPTGSTVSSGQGTNIITLSFGSTFTTGSLSVLASNGCGNSAMRTLVLNSVPAMPGAIAGTVVGLCSAGITSSTYSVVANTAATSYTWTAPAGAVISSGQGSNSVTINFGSTFTTGSLSVVANNACGSSAVRTLVLNSVPAMPGVITGTIVGLCSAGITSSTYSVVANAAVTSYTWTAPTGASISSGQGSNAVIINFGSTFTTGSLSVVANNACGSSAVRSLVLNSTPATPGVIGGQSVGLCTAGNTSSTYTIASVAGASFYLWSVPSGTVINGGQGTTSLSLGFGSGFSTGTLSVMAFNDCGNSATRTLVLRSVPVAPGAISGSTVGLCLTGITSATYSIVPVVGATYYTWTTPTGIIINSGQGTTLINVSFGNTFTTGTLAVTADNACGSSAVKTLTLLSAPSTPVSIGGPTLGLCVGGISSTTYTTAPVSGATSYTWSVPVGATIDAGQGTTAVNVSFGSTFTTGTVSVVAVNTCGSSLARSITIRSVLVSPATIFGIADGLCVPGISATSYSIAAVTGATLYNWIPPTGMTITSGQGSNMVTVSVDGTFTNGNISVVAVNACGNSPTKTLALRSIPSTPASITGSGSICANQVGVVYSCASVLSATSYTWTVPAGATIASGQGTTSVVVNFGATAGSICAKANNACGTGITRCLTVSITCLGTINNNNGRAPEINSDNIFTVAPNPTNGIFQINNITDEERTIEIMDILGNVVYKGQTSKAKTEIDISEVPTGIYFIKIVNIGNVSVTSQRIIKQ